MKLSQAFPYSARNDIIEANKPDRIIMFGGELGLIWVDAHSDLVKHDGCDNAHSLPLGKLLGEGDNEFTKEVKIPLNPDNVFLAGIEETTEKEIEMIQRLGIRTASTKELELETGTESINKWIIENEIKHLAIHLDLDVLDPKAFRSLLFANPDLEEYIGFPTGIMQFPQLINLIKELSEKTDVVGLSITEHLPWDSINIKNMLKELPILIS
ncbi:arginase [Psychrobacillus psychrodurans]|nr:arginase [Psychrobacillus psychrodurans]